jgi:PAS domain S-box-containing protein
MTEQFSIDAFGAMFANSLRPAALFADASGCVRFWSAGATRLFGHEASEALGAKMDFIVPPALREAHWAGFNRAVAAPAWPGSPSWGSVPAVHRDGRDLALEAFLSRIDAADGGAVGVLALFREAAGVTAFTDTPAQSP